MICNLNNITVKIYISSLYIHGTIEPQVASFLGMKELTGNCRAWLKKCLYKAVQTAALEH